MNYKETVTQLMSHSDELHILPGDDLTEEMYVMRDAVLPYFDVNQSADVHIRACATLFRCASRYAAEMLGMEQTTLWTDLEELYEKKNADYGDSWKTELGFFQTKYRFGILCHYIRMYEKVNRVISISTHGAMVKDESVIDTLKDICNYCVMTAMWINNKK